MQGKEQLCGVLQLDPGGVKLVSPLKLYNGDTDSLAQLYSKFRQGWADGKLKDVK